MQLIGVIIALCILFIIILFGYFTIMCIISAWWNILLILVIILILVWCKIRRKKEQTIWQGIVVIIVAMLFLMWFLIPCITQHYKEFDEGAVSESKTDSDSSKISPMKLNEDEDQKKKQYEENKLSEQEKESQKEVAREKAEQADREAKEKTKEPEKACLNIKGNISSSGEKIFHMPNGEFYTITEPEDIFCSISEARASGYRESKR